MKKAKVLLVSPNLKGVKDGLNRIQPSLGLMLIARSLLDAKHDVRIYDTALEGWNNRKEIDENMVMIGLSDEDIKKVISDFSPDVVAISVLFSNLIESAHNIARLAKEVNKKIKVILGGNHISNAVIDYEIGLKDKNSNLPTKIMDLEDKNVDIAMIGEGDFTMVRLIDGIINKNDQEVDKIPGLVRSIGEKKYLINHPERIKDIANLPTPARHLVNMEGYFKIGAFHSAKSRSKRVLSVMCSRGCPEKCTFCTTPQMWGQKVRWRPIEKIISEIKNGIKDFDIGEIQFEDDSLTANKKKLIELCSELEKIGLPWCTPNGVKVNYHLATQPDLFRAMKDSGCYQLTLACESGVQRVLDDIIYKNLKVDTIKPAIENAKKAGLLVHTFWILGYPGETYEEIQSTVNFALSSGADSFSFAILSPLPGTPIYRKVLKENLWWNNRSLEDMLFRSSLVKVDGFKGPEEFEKFVSEVNVKANMMLKTKDPKRFEYKYGANADEKSFIKQT